MPNWFPLTRPVPAGSEGEDGARTDEGGRPVLPQESQVALDSVRKGQSRKQRRRKGKSQPESRPEPPPAG